MNKVVEMVAEVFDTRIERNLSIVNSGSAYVVLAVRHASHSEIRDALDSIHEHETGVLTGYCHVDHNQEYPCREISK